MNLLTAINKKKTNLIAKARKNGLYENFGESEIRELEAKFIDTSNYGVEMNQRRNLINSFENWCMSFDLSQLKNNL